ncbi:dethiobiotin synthase [Candidatus Macondimonas diazotrophica]|nr:dethiobiotin synthase [Candidatus Macondimonas diazotrophica]
MMTNGWFVTGTDTEIGKTHVSSGLLRLFASQGLKVAGFKPVATGCALTPCGLRNDDALALMRASTVDVPYDLVNPCAFVPPIAPHLAAEAAGVEICPDRILGAFSTLADRADLVVAEGAGGWRVPLGDDWEMADLARRLGMPVILVVGMRLGCLNHALLSAQAIGGQLCGWVANHLERDMAAGAGNLATLQARMPVPCLGVIPYDGPAEAHLNPVLLQSTLGGRSG